MTTVSQCGADAVGSCAFIVGKTPRLRSKAALTGEDFKRNLQIADLDFATIHVYPSNWGVPAGTCLSWVNNDWIGDRAALAAAAGKPLVLEVGLVPSAVAPAAARRLGCAQGLHQRHIIDKAPHSGCVLSTSNLECSPGAHCSVRRPTLLCPTEPAAFDAVAGVRHATRLLRQPRHAVQQVCSLP